jgi:hypothetical protein
MEMLGSNKLALHVGAACVLVALSGMPGIASALPAGWTCIGNCNVAPHGPDGDVTAPPGGGTYNWVSTVGAPSNAGLDVPPNSETNGSIARSVVFSATAGDKLEFDFNYITSDGSIYIEYAWARVLNPALADVALLFTARTTPSPGNTVPGPGMPPLGAGVVLEPATIPIIAGAPEFSPLGGHSNTCFAAGCGLTDWVHSTYTILDSGDYILEFGVVNWLDTDYDSAFAFAGTTIAGEPIEDPTVPEPGTVALLGLGLAVAAYRLRSRRRLT